MIGPADSLLDGYLHHAATSRQAFVIKVVPHTGTTTDIPSLALSPLLPKQDLDTSTRSQFSERILMILKDFSRLPLPSGCIHAISIRSLYKDLVSMMPGAHDVGIMHSSPSTGTFARLLLRECHRLLSMGGILEYIFIDKALENAGPLVTVMEDRFHSFHSSPRMCGGSPSLTIEEFLGHLDAAGFSGGRKVVLKFPYMVLSQLFTKDGERRESSQGALSFEDLCKTQERWETGNLEHEAARRLSMSIDEETSTLKTSWKCVVGWTVKSSNNVRFNS